VTLPLFGDTLYWGMGIYPQKCPHRLWILAYQNGQSWTTEKEKAQHLLGFQDIHGLARMLGWCEGGRRIDLYLYLQINNLIDL